MKNIVESGDLMNFVFIPSTTVKAFVDVINTYASGPVAVYLGWMLLHYFAAHAYSKYCVNWSIVGFFMSPFVTTTPICRGISWVIYEGSNTITYMWVLVGTTISIYLTKQRVQ